MTAWWIVVAVLGAAGGYVFAAFEHTSPSDPHWTAAGLAWAVIVGHLRIYLWWGPLVAWCGFMVGLVPPRSMQDALWLVIAGPVAVLAIGWAALVNCLMLLMHKKVES